MKHCSKSVLKLLTFAFLAAGLQFPALAQTSTGQISGTLTDSAGAAIPGATVEVTNTDTQISRDVTSDGSGAYILKPLSPGNYRLVISKQGFATKTIDSIKLDVNQGIALNEQLNVGSTSQTIQVNGQSELLQTSDSTLGTVISGDTVKALPLNGRNFTQLLTLVPGATPVNTSQNSGVGGYDGATIAIPGSVAVTPSINGQENREVLYLLDGIINTDFRVSTYTVLPIVDGISQFKVQSHNDDPSFGSVLGGVVNLVTKSGTNQLHGDGWEFARNSIFDARNSFTDFGPTGAAAPPAEFSQNQFGGTVGGPIWIPKVYDGKNKSFFFFAYEGWRYSQASNSLYDVPTAAELNGDFSKSLGFTQIYDPTTTAINATGTGYTRQPFAGSVIPANRINKSIQTYLLDYFDRPNLTGTVSGYNTQLLPSQTSNNNSYQVRVDENLTSKDNIFVRYNSMLLQTDQPSSNKVSGDTAFNGLSVGAGITHIFNQHLVLNVQGGRASQAFLGTTSATPGYGPLPALGFPGTDTFGPLNISLSAPYGSAGLASAQLRRNSNWSVTSALNWQVGRHTITFGEFFVNQYRSSHGSGQNLNFATEQTADPENQGTTGNSLASALLGYPSGGTFQLNNTLLYNIPTWAAYVQDSWAISPRLTFNIGMRYDSLGRPTSHDGIVSEFNFDTGNYDIGGGKLPPACIVSHAAPCIPGNSTDASVDLAATLGNDGSVAGSHIVISPNPVPSYGKTSTMFGPRIGFAFKANDTTVARGGFGIVYDTLNGWSQIFQNPIGGWPSEGSTSNNYNLIGAPLETALTALNNVTSPITTGSPFTQNGYFNDQNNKPMYSEQFNFQVEKTLNQATVLTVGYVGSVGRRVDYSGVANGALTPGPGTVAQVNARRPFPYETTFEWDQFKSNSNYNSLQMELERKFSNNLQFLISYTWSKAIDTGGSGLFGAENGPGGGSAVQNFYDPVSNRSVSAFDIPQYASISGLYALPFGKGQRFMNSGIASRLLGNWQLNTVAQLSSGQVYTMQVPGDIANVGITGGGYGRPNLVGNPHPTNPSRNQWFNPAAFSTPQFSYGNVGRDSMRSSSSYDDDLSLFKTFPLNETTSLEFRAEAFNILNIVSYGVPDSNLGDTTAGVVSSMVGNPRQLQLALKVNF